MIMGVKLRDSHFDLGNSVFSFNYVNLTSAYVTRCSCESVIAGTASISSSRFEEISCSADFCLVTTATLSIENSVFTTCSYGSFFSGNSVQIYSSQFRNHTNEYLLLATSCDIRNSLFMEFTDSSSALITCSVGVTVVDSAFLDITHQLPVIALQSVGRLTLKSSLFLRIQATIVFSDFGVVENCLFMDVNQLPLQISLPFVNNSLFSNTSGAFTGDNGISLYTVPTVFCSTFSFANSSLVSQGETAFSYCQFVGFSPSSVCSATAVCNFTDCSFLNQSSRWFVSQLLPRFPTAHCVCSVRSPCTLSVDIIFSPTIIHSSCTYSPSTFSSSFYFSFS